MVSQSESPWYYEETIRSMTGAMATVFSHVQTYVAMIPLYPSGFWTITAASDTCRLERFDEERSRRIASRCRYYNPDIHRGSLALPNFVRDMAVNR